MIFIKLSFPTGRWHATAWGSHVNEGIPEWPPCPWRLCRALLAAWHWKHQRDEDILRSLIEKLATQLPDYFLPEASAAHTRHYMPVIAGPKETKTKIFDTFVHVTAGQSLLIRWDVDLTPQEHHLLQCLLEKINYMGRAESLVHASLANCYPKDARESEWTSPVEKSSMGDQGEPIRLLTPQLPADYAAWAATQTVPADKKTKGKNKKVPLPDTLFSALQLDTADWKKDGWNLPPGSRWIEYLRPRDCFKIAPRSESSKYRKTLPTVARFAIISKVPPSITQALSLSERFHQTLCYLLSGEKSSSLTGLDENGAALKDNGHVYFLPECDQHGYVTHMTLQSPKGFDEAACRSLRKVRKVWGAEGFDVKMILLAMGQPEDFEIASPFFQKSKTWVSVTPFIPVRHPKATRSGTAKIDPKTGLQIASPEHDCTRLLELHAAELGIEKDFNLIKVSLDESAMSKGTRIKTGLRNIPCMDFQRNRHTGEGTRAGNRGYALRLEFKNEVCLPFGVGYAAHFGLGLFAPVFCQEVS